MSTKRYCDICETQYYELIRKNFDKSIRDSVDICNDCLKKVIALAKNNLIEVIGITTCDNCKHYDKNSNFCKINGLDLHWYDHDYCSHGEKEDKEK